MQHPSDEYQSKAQCLITGNPVRRFGYKAFLRTVKYLYVDCHAIYM